MADKEKILKIAAVVLPLIGLFLPFWVIKFNAPLYGQKWLEITIYGYGATQGPIDQINIANHYVGLPEIHPEEMLEIKVLPLVFISATVISALMVFRKEKRRALAILYVLLLLSIPAYFQYWLYDFGHSINYETAAIKIKPFTPLVIGAYQIANFKAVAYFHLGYWLLVASFILAYKVERK